MIYITCILTDNISIYNWVRLYAVWGTVSPAPEPQSRESCAECQTSDNDNISTNIETTYPASSTPRTEMWEHCTGNLASESLQKEESEETKQRSLWSEIWKWDFFHFFSPPSWWWPSAALSTIRTWWDLQHYEYCLSSEMSGCVPGVEISCQQKKSSQEKPRV